MHHTRHRDETPQVVCEAVIFEIAQDKTEAFVTPPPVRLWLVSSSIRISAFVISVFSFDFPISACPISAFAFAFAVSAFPISVFSFSFPISAFLF